MAHPSHLDWLIDTGERKTTACGRQIEVWALAPKDDAGILSAWAWHFRQQYITDADFPAMIAGTGVSKADYLRSVLLPDAKVAPGPSLRSGDFGEILAADYIEFVLGYWYPRELRYQDRWNRNESTKGCDIIGFKFVKDGEEHPRDELLVFEAKSGMTVTKAHRLQDAVNDSMKDKFRESMSLNAIKRRFVDRGALGEAGRVQRFQNQTDRPFRRINGAAAILDTQVFLETDLTTVDASTHPNAGNLRLLVITGPSLMKLVHELYERAADEA